ncbi:ribosome biogenesis protein SLX9 homolog [Monodelphis domestica]|uniref:ribosome biogenesis protein SLX9 homolog n=1 Tax=Monodelphis domestica TaxID=13616 RepID=UPI0024E19DFC|nr:ribosome biogenesis protein SLX9 homolog [Monodelphis domestica]
MVGKVRRPRARLHVAAVKTTRPAPNGDEAAAAAAAAATSLPAEVTAWSGAGGQAWAPPTSDVFSGTSIDPKVLVQRLEPDMRSVSAGAEASPVLSKKERLKQRRARWLQKIDAIKAAEESRKAEARRKATVVVGDMRPLAEALPELAELVTAGRPRKELPRAPRQKARPTNFSRMTTAQKRQLLEDEMTRFREVLASPSYQADPLRAISEHLSRRLRPEEAGRF